MTSPPKDDLQAVIDKYCAPGHAVYLSDGVLFNHPEEGVYVARYANREERRSIERWRRRNNIGQVEDLSVEKLVALAPDVLQETTFWYLSSWLRPTG